MTETANFGLNKPTVGASTDTWGTELNLVIDGIDAQMKVNADAVANITPFVPTNYVLRSGGSFTGNITAPTFVGALSGNATTSTRWATARTLTVTGDATGSIELDGSADGELNLTVTGGGGGATTIGQVTGLQAALNAKEPTLAANQKRVITAGTAAVGATLATGAIYLQHEA